MDSKWYAYTKHFAERYLERVREEDYRHLLPEIKRYVSAKACVLAFECAKSRSNRTRFTIRDYAVAAMLQDNKKLYITTIYRKEK